MTQIGPGDAFLIVVGFTTLMGVSAAAMALGVAVACKWMNWAPINVSVTVFEPKNPATADHE